MLRPKIEPAPARTVAELAPEEAGANGAGAAAPAAARQGGLAVARMLRQREFALFWVGQSISLVGTWMQAFAQGWVVASLTTSAIALGLVNFAMSFPTLVLTPFGGVAADRLERRRILMYAQWVFLILAAVIGVLIARHRLQLWHVYLIALPLGIATAFELPAYQSFYPQLVEREDLPQAISLNQASFHGARIIGPALAGWMIGLWGTAAAFFANSASFLAVIVSLGLIRTRPAPEGSGHRSTWGMMREGVHYVRERPQVQALLGLTGITTLFIFPNLAVLTPFYARHVLEVGPSGLGTMMSVSGGGALLGSLLLLSVPAERRVGRIVIAASTIMVTMSALAWSKHLWISVIAIAFQSLAISHSLGLSSIIVQEIVPDALRGRVMGLYSMMFTGIMPFAALAIPRLADLIGMRREMQVSAILYGSAALLLLWRLRAVTRAD